MKICSSWSGGKDSCFALYEAMNSGYTVSCLVNTISKEYNRVRFHGTEAKLIQLQSEAIGIPLLQKETTAGAYEDDFKDAVRNLIFQGAEGMVFGDIDIQENRDWVERVCGDLGIKAVEPLWQRDREKILLDFMDKGFGAIVVSAKANLFGDEWVGHNVDREFLEYLKANNIDVCGERGEYHTFVTDGPLFKKRIEIIKSNIIQRNGYRFLDTKEYSSSWH